MPHLTVALGSSAAAVTIASGRPTPASLLDGRAGSWQRALLLEMFPFAEGILWNYIKHKNFTF